MAAKSSCHISNFLIQIYLRLSLMSINIYRLQLSHSGIFYEFKMSNSFNVKLKISYIIFSLHVHHQIMSIVLVYWLSNIMTIKILRLKWTNKNKNWVSSNFLYYKYDYFSIVSCLIGLHTLNIIFHKTIDNTEKNKYH